MTGPFGFFQRGNSSGSDGPESVADLFGVQSAADHDDRHGMDFHDFPRGLIAIHPGHLDIHGDNVRMRLLHQPDSLISVSGHSRNFEFLIHTDNMSEVLLNCRRIIHNEDFNHNNSPVN